MVFENTVAHATKRLHTATGGVTGTVECLWEGAAWGDQRVQ